jgi:hypothetical protein
MRPNHVKYEDSAMQIQLLPIIRPHQIALQIHVRRGSRTLVELSIPDAPDKTPFKIQVDF